MENASKAIEIAISAILFIVAAIIAVILYSKMQDIIDMGLYINNIDTVTMYDDEDFNSDGIEVNKAELYYIIKNIVNEQNAENNYSIFENTEIYFQRNLI